MAARAASRISPPANQKACSSLREKLSQRQPKEQTSVIRQASLSEHPEFLTQPSEADVVRSLLAMMSFNLAQQSFLHAVLHGLDK
ncbi:pantothenate kinase [Cyclospora cayetanensis]|uniref:Pantothenate kinase n=1 Tax=Cyclospora cayetanensis TaxID=88456 RepID=A0A1D3D0V1_9EIME|nr:pantothenate kinase [Cyclospora cayetanensis]